MVVSGGSRQVIAVNGSSELEPRELTMMSLRRVGRVSETTNAPLTLTPYNLFI